MFYQILLRATIEVGEKRNFITMRSIQVNLELVIRISAFLGIFSNETVKTILIKSVWSHWFKFLPVYISYAINITRS